MKINVTLTIEVDPAEWADVYGLESTAAVVRADIRDYTLHQVQQATGMIESGAIVTLK